MNLPALPEEAQHLTKDLLLQEYLFLYDRWMRQKDSVARLHQERENFSQIRSELAEEVAKERFQKNTFLQQLKEAEEYIDELLSGNP